MSFKFLKPIHSVSLRLRSHFATNRMWRGWWHLLCILYHPVVAIREIAVVIARYKLAFKTLFYFFQTLECQGYSIYPCYNWFTFTQKLILWQNWVTQNCRSCDKIQISLCGSFVGSLQCNPDEKNNTICKWLYPRQSYSSEFSHGKLNVKIQTFRASMKGPIKTSY